MKRFIGISVFILALTLVSADLFAYSARRGAEWVKNPSRCATINSVDAAQYNPAGLINLQDGLYIYLGNQAAIKKYTVGVIGKRDAVDNTPAFLSPNATLAYVVGSGAVFATFDVIGGGGSVHYTQPEGLNFVSSFASPANLLSHATLYEAKTAISVGVAYGLFNDMLSVSTGIRYVMHDKSITANINDARAISATASLTGWAPFIGVNIQPNAMFNIGIMFQPTFRKRGEIRNHIDGARYNSADGLNYFGVLPFVDDNDEYENGYASIGLGIRPIENLEIQLSFKYNFNKQRRIGTSATLDAAGYGNSLVENALNRTELEFGIGFEYSLGLIRPSMGVWHDSTSDLSRTNRSTPWDPGLTSTSVGIGFSIVPNDTLRIDLGVLKAFYAEGSSGAYGISVLSFKKDVWVIGYGIALRF